MVGQFRGSRVCWLPTADAAGRSGGNPGQVRREPEQTRRILEKTWPWPVSDERVCSWGFPDPGTARVFGPALIWLHKAKGAPKRALFVFLIFRFPA